MHKNNKQITSESRRSFLKKSLIGGIAAASFPSLTFAEKANKEIFSRISIQPSELDEITIAELREGMKSCKYTAHSITEHYIKRINEIDKNGPEINSVIEINPDALTIADELDKEFKRKGSEKSAAWNSNSNQR